MVVNMVKSQNLNIQFQLTLVRVVPYFIFDRDENETVRDRIKCVQLIVLLQSSSEQPIVQMMKHLCGKNFQWTKLCCENYMIRNLSTVLCHCKECRRSLSLTLL